MAVDSSNNQLKMQLDLCLVLLCLDVLENDILRNIKKISKEDINDKSSEMVRNFAIKGPSSC